MRNGAYTVTVGPSGKQLDIGETVDRLEIMTAREAGSGMAIGNRQHDAITISKEWSAANRTVEVVSDSNWIKLTVTATKAPMGTKRE